MCECFHTVVLLLHVSSHSFESVVNLKLLFFLGGSLIIHGTSALESVYMPHLTEITNGHVFIWAADNLCHLLTIDFYGELFQNPCNPLKEHNTTETNCQYASILYSCCKYLGKLCDVQQSRVAKARDTSEFIIRDFWPNNSAKICKSGRSDKFIMRTHPGMYAVPKTIASIYGLKDRDIHRCWLSTDGNAGQIQTRSKCPPKYIDGNLNKLTDVYRFDGRCLGDEKTGFRTCPDACIGGCIDLPYLGPDDARPKDYDKAWKKLNKWPWQNQNKFANMSGIQEHQLDITCNVCRSTTTQLPGSSKCDNDKHCERHFVSIVDNEVCFDHNADTLGQKGLVVYPKPEYIVCPSHVPHYDKEKTTCVKFCSKSTFEFEQLRNGNGRADCINEENCESPTRGKDKKPLNGFECGDNRICYGHGNPRWKEFLDESKEFKVDHDADTHFTTESIKSIKDCTILDGNFAIKFGDYSSDFTTKGHICAYVRKLKVITGYIQLHGWHGDNLDCFESLEEVWGKNLIENDGEPLALDIRSMLVDSPRQILLLTSLGLPRLRKIVTGSVRVVPINKNNTDAVSDTCGYDIPLQICQLEQLMNGQNKAVPNAIFKVNGEKSTVNDDPKRLNYQIEIQKGTFIVPVTWQKLKDAQCPKYTDENKQCYLCHASCNEVYGCSGPSEFDCVKCAHLIDKSVEYDCFDGASCRKQAYLTSETLIYKNEATEFNDNDKLGLSASCTSSDKCPDRSYQQGDACYPCDAECAFACNGPQADHCCSKNGVCLSELLTNETGVFNAGDVCRHYLLEDRETHPLWKRQGPVVACVRKCEGINETIVIDGRYMKQIDAKDMDEKNITVYPYSSDFSHNNRPKVCGICSGKCLGGCDQPFPDDTFCFADHEKGCYNDTVTDMDTTNNIRRFVGEQCSNGWSFRDINGVDLDYNEMVPICKVKCENKERCIIDLAAGSTHCEAISNKAMVGGIIGGLLALLFVIIGGVSFYWQKERNERPDQLAKEILNLTYRSDPIRNQANSGYRNAIHFADINFIDPKDLVIERELGDGHFGRVCFAKFRKRYNLNSISGNESGYMNTSSMRCETVTYSVAVKELKLDQQVIGKTIANIISLVKRYMKSVDQASLEPSEGYNANRKMGTLSSTDPEFIRYKRLFFQAKQAELIEETKKVAPLKHPHLIRLIGIVKQREDQLKDGVTRFTPAQMVVDFVPGGELKKWISGNRHQIDDRHMSRWMHQIAMAMAYLERNHIVHRDLAIRNILLQKTKPEETHVLVSDFGLAKIIDNEADFNRNKEEQIPINW